MTAALTLTPRQMTLVRRTVARDCNDDEFNLFVEAAKSYGLDPFRKQVLALVFSKDTPSKRRMSIIVSRDGLRVMAQRCGDYRPASDPAEIKCDDAAKCPTNPKGILKATVKLWKQDNRGEWFPVAGEAYWDEFAPVRERWAYDQGEGKRRPTGEYELDASGNWARMPIVMITKCAEAQALRAGWPDTFGGVYAEEEMAQAVAADASEVVQQEAERERMERIGGNNTITMTWGDGWKLDMVPVGQMADRCLEFIGQEDAKTIEKWRQANAEPLRQFWAMAPSDALAVKQAIEAKLAKAPKADQEKPKEFTVKKDDGPERPEEARQGAEKREERLL